MSWTRGEKVGVGVGAGAAVAAIVFEAVRRSSATSTSGPGAVQGISYTNGVLSWSPLSGATYYEITSMSAVGTPVDLDIEVGGATGTDFQITGQTTTGKLMTTVSPVLDGASYFAIRGCTAVACGPWSGVQAFSTAAPALPTPGAVSGITVSNITSTSATVSWTANPSSDQVSYYEFMHVDSTGAEATSDITVNGAAGTDFKVTGTSVQITNLAPSSPLHFMVRACN